MAVRRGHLLLLALLTALIAVPSARALSYSPYVDMTLYSDPGLPAVQRATGAHLISLGFVIASGSRCAPSWGGIVPLRSQLIHREVATVRARHGDVIVSFGGQAGPDLSHVCSSPQRLASAYASAVVSYGARQVDFDLEGAALDDPAGSRREVLAIGLLERWARSRHQRLEVSLTVPVDPIGLQGDVVRVLRIARAHGVRLDVVDIMAMDYGDQVAPPSGSTMAGYAISAAQHAERQIAGGFSHLEVTVMIGMNDDPNEVFTTADAASLIAFARSHGLARLGIWSVARDRACRSPARVAQDTCSGVQQSPNEFSRILAGGH